MLFFGAVSFLIGTHKSVNLVQLALGTGLQQIVEAVLLLNCLVFPLLVILGFQQRFPLLQLVLLVLQTLPQAEQLGDILRPDRMAAVHRHIVDLYPFRECRRAGLRLPHFLHRDLRRVFGSILDSIILVHDLRCQSGLPEQFPVAGVGLDQAALDTKFQRGSDQQAENHGCIGGKRFLQRQLDDVEYAINHCQ